MNSMIYRIHPDDLIDPDEQSDLPIVSEESVPYMVAREHDQAVMPKALIRLMDHIIHTLKEGKSITVISEEEAYTTQAAAQYLGVSRQHVVDLLKQNSIPYHLVGTHRRILFKDLVEYAQMRDREKHEAINSLFKKINDAGLYDDDHLGDDC